MWTVHNIAVGPLRIALGTSPRGWPFALVVVWVRRNRPALILCDLGTANGE